MKRRSALVALALLSPAAALAQQPPPVGISPVTLAAEPYHFDTAEVHGIAVSVVAKDFGRPFAMEFLPNGDLLVAERAGNLRIIRAAITPGAVMDTAPIAGMPQPGTSQGNFGLHDLAVDPGFASNGLIYWTWNIPVPNAENPEEPPQQGRLAIMRGRLTADGLSGVTTVFAMEEPGYAGGSRLQVTADGIIWIATGAPFGASGQDMASPHGKVLRINTYGSIPADNPFVGQAGAHPAIYSLGHRDQHGLTIHPANGDVFTAEHGPNGGDEVNLIRAGGNYGWPAYTFGRNYDGTPMGVPMQGEGITDPLLLWQPSIAPSGLLFYTGAAFPAWQGNLFIGSARRGEINFTGGLERIVFNDQFGELRRERLLTQLHQRIRDVVQGPDGLIYVLTDGNENAVLRIAPGE
ncbi:PQQ-dependent sugar dehydrogenase [Alteraurantiacibacter aestuarii]|uniref:PQQ-dependent sugar dehydrogenase n=1 Tax=Alteraurantiacibacter aestuarii TaxID=650004 RepID=A0A844ZJ05_9SPHN|nr:PQQ-dependent sugar dehydrogenase [Alteraurantiacibacter aestuarii]MXO87765.1 PQQ-dependent sugar dehydrogenase [Alteraurantiacibacter aestuarii]